MAGFHSIAIFIWKEYHNDSNLSSFQGAAEASKSCQKLKVFCKERRRGKNVAFARKHQTKHFFFILFWTEIQSHNSHYPITKNWHSILIHAIRKKEREIEKLNKRNEIIALSAFTIIVYICKEILMFLPFPRHLQFVNRICREFDVFCVAYIFSKLSSKNIFEQRKSKQFILFNIMKIWQT